MHVWSALRKDCIAQNSCSISYFSFSTYLWRCWFPPLPTLFTSSSTFSISFGSTLRWLIILDHWSGSSTLPRITVFTMDETPTASTKTMVSLPLVTIRWSSAKTAKIRPSKISQYVVIIVRLRSNILFVCVDSFSWCAHHLGSDVWNISAWIREGCLWISPPPLNVGPSLGTDSSPGLHLQEHLVAQGTQRKAKLSLQRSRVVTRETKARMHWRYTSCNFTTGDVLVNRFSPPFSVKYNFHWCRYLEMKLLTTLKFHFGSVFTAPFISFSLSMAPMR